MKNRFYHKTLFFLSTLVLLVSCKDSETVDPVLTVSEKEITIVAEGGEATITVDCNDTWTVNNSAAWLQVDMTSGSSGTATITVSTPINATGANRSVILHINSSNGQSRRVKVIQAAFLYPVYNLTPQDPDPSGMGSTATELVAKMHLGINIGNTLELINIMPDPTEANIKFIKEMGFDAVRLPCAWNLNVEDYNSKKPTENKAKIKSEYLAKVKQVVQWCVENDLYVMVNCHWDGGWLESKEWNLGDDNEPKIVPTENYDPSSNRKDEVNGRQKAYWEQIATALRDFDEHVLFASSNEPNASSAEEMQILLSYHKTFINAVRSTGGRNTYRTLVLQGDDRYISPSDFAALNDPTPNRLAYEFHNYTPSSMTILSDDAPIGWDNVRFYWGEGNHVAGLENGIERNCEYGEEAELLEAYNHIKTKFIDAGIPCLMGEYSCQRWKATSKFVPQDLDKHNKSVDDWYTFVTKNCIAIGGVPFLWETGGMYDRGTNVIKDQRSYDAIIAGAQE